MGMHMADFSKWRFLVVDDSPQVRLMACKMLASCDARGVHHAANGAEALSMLQALGNFIDCILCDWNMEPMDGLSLLAAIRKGAVSSISRDLRFIMLTGHSESDIVENARALSVSGFLVKPVSMQKMVATVGSVMARDSEIKPAGEYSKVPTIKLPDTLRLSRNARNQ